jgi:hypothetical protein
MDISNDDLWEELFKELAPEIPDNAKTVKMMLDEKKRIGESALRNKLEKLVEQGWNKVFYNGKHWYWPPD